MAAREIPSSIRPALERLAALLRPQLGPRLRDVRLFGSYARGDANEDSDIDVVVLVDDLELAEFRMVTDAAAQVAIATALPLAVMPMSTSQLDALRKGERSFASELDTEGVSL